MKERLERAFASKALDMEAVLELAEWQRHRIEAVRALCELRHIELKKVRHWLDLPAIPTTAFKRFELYAGGEVAAEFRTSGTSGSVPGRALFSADGLQLMAKSIEINASRMLFPNETPSQILVLAPPPSLAPSMIMAWGMQHLVERFGAPGSGFLVDGDGVDVERLLALLEGADGPVTLIGASFGFVHLLDLLRARGFTASLPIGSRIMDAGGFKGRSRSVSGGQLRADLAAVFGVEPSHQLNLLGMTELASQFYDSSIHDPQGDRRKMNPPWTATAAMDPVTMLPVPDGELGLLRHLDLANLDRPFVIQTDDLGRRVEGGFEIVGRAVNANDRGCSITVDDLLSRGDR
jgi:hypothetical protein